MKKISRVILIFGMMFMGFVACKDDSLVLVPEWETGVNTYSKLATGSPSAWVAGDVSKTISVNWRWISIDNLNTVNKVEFYVLFNEAYVDKDANPAAARHGGSTGKLVATLEGSAVKGNREDISLTVTQDQVYQLYKNNTYNYCGTAVSVFSNTLKPQRTAAAPFLNGDTFTLKWIIYLADGRKIDSWSPSVCTEFPGSNCQFAWSVTGTKPLPGACQ